MTTTEFPAKVQFTGNEGKDDIWALTFESYTDFNSYIMQKAGRVIDYKFL